MRLSTQLARMTILFLILACARLALASALPPCLKAASSKNGNFLVITDVLLEPQHGNTLRVRRATLQVFPKENFNARERLIAPVTHWTNWLQWSVVLRPRNKQPVTACPLTLITDDGEFLIVLHLHTADFDALQIYRRRDHIGDPARRGLDHGVFIKNITLIKTSTSNNCSLIYREDKLVAP